MHGIHIVKSGLCLAMGTVGAIISAFFGGWDGSLTTLVSFMAADYLSGMIVAGIFHKSEKTSDGTLESRAGWKGIIRKGMSLFIVWVACRLDLLIGTDIVRDAVIIALIVNETLSLIENFGLMGVPIPKVLISAIHVLKEQADKGTEAVEAMKEKEDDEE